MQELPKSLGPIAETVRTLDAAKNQLTDFPKVIAAMTALQRLVLSENRISSCVMSVAPLTKLKVSYVHQSSWFGPFKSVRIQCESVPQFS